MFAKTTTISVWTKLARYAITAIAVGLYVGIGFLLKPDANTYLLIGIPITVLFQAFIARRPLRELWLRHEQPLRFDRWTVAWLVLFLIGPILTFVTGIRFGNWPVTVYGLAAVFGAVGAALAFRVLGPANLRQLGLLLALTILLGLARLLLQPSSAGAQDLAPSQRLLEGVQSLLFYVPALFIVEEVFFRGALNSYLHQGESGAGWPSAVFVSVLWGLWHTPIIGPLSLIIVLQVVVVQLVIGLILSWYWRQSGNLAMPATIHAILSALRNALMV